MAVIRIEKSKGYTVMSNYHLRDKNLSLKAKGLLSMMLSLPDGWHYNVRGLASICKEGTTSISAVLRELGECGYMQRHQPTVDGKFQEIEYVIYEFPQTQPSDEPDGDDGDGADGGDDDTDAADDAPGPDTYGTDEACAEMSCPDSATAKKKPHSRPSQKSAPAGAPGAEAVSAAPYAAALADGISPAAPCSRNPYTGNPCAEKPCTENPYTGNLHTGNPHTESPYTENPHTEEPHTGNPHAKLNKDQVITERSNTDQSNYPSINQGRPAASCGGRSARTGGMDAMDASEQEFLLQLGAQRDADAFSDYREIVERNLSFDSLCITHNFDRSTLEGIVDLMVEAICSKAPYIRIGGQDVPQSVVKSRFLKLDSGHIEYVLICLAQNTTKVRNMKQYLLTALYNAPATIDAYYQNWVQSDFPEMAQH